MNTAAAHADLLADSIDRAGSPVCVGLDPVVGRLPEALAGYDDEAERVEHFCTGVVEAVAGVVGVVKPQSACFERFGSAGVAVLERVIARAREAGLFVILDVKRGDIGSTAAHYAAAATGLGAHAVTVNAYMGASSIEPFLDAGLMVFVLVRTSNPDSGVIQGEALARGGTLAEHTARLVHELGRAHVGERGLSGVGAVVGATRADEGAALRELMPDTPFLVPGVGTQGGRTEDLAPMARPATSAGGLGLVVNASRSVLFAGDGTDGRDWNERVRARAKALADEGRALHGTRSAV